MENVVRSKLIEGGEPEIDARRSALDGNGGGR
jgi:hypothetical protein